MQRTVRREALGGPANSYRDWWGTRCLVVLTLSASSGSTTFRDKNCNSSVKKLKTTMVSLLVCIAFYFVEARLVYLKSVVDNFLSNFDFDVTIYIDTTSNALNDFYEVELRTGNLKIFVHERLLHSHHLTWIHRSHVLRELERYDVFLYSEDDILLPSGSLDQYLANFNNLWPAYVPAFVRVEEFNDVLYSTDFLRPERSSSARLRLINDTLFLSPSQRSYNALWVLPRNVIAELVANEFSEFITPADDLIRESAASLTLWYLGRDALIHVEKCAYGMRVHNKSIIYHLPNNYASAPESQFGKVPLTGLIRSSMFSGVSYLLVNEVLLILLVLLVYKFSNNRLVRYISGCIPIGRSFGVRRIGNLNARIGRHFTRQPNCGE